MMTRRRRKLAGKQVSPFTVYLPKDLDEWLRSLAKQEGRTLTKQTEMILVAGRTALSRSQSS